MKLPFFISFLPVNTGAITSPDCSNMCHEPTSVGLAASIGVGKGTVLLEDFEKCDLVICIGHNPGYKPPSHVDFVARFSETGSENDRHQSSTGTWLGAIYRTAKPV